MKHFFFLLLVSAFLSSKISAQEILPIPDSGLASYYGDKFKGRKTANGETYNPKDFTAAHKMLPFNSIVRVTNIKNNQSVVVRVNDRGPYSRHRILDLSKAAANKIDLLRFGVTEVKIEILPDSTDIELENSKEPILNPFTSGFNNLLSELPHSREQLVNMDMVTVPAKGYGIQVKSFDEDFNAIYFCNELKKDVDPSEIFIQKTKSHHKTHYRVIVGNFQREVDGKDLLTACKSIYKESFVKKLKD